MVFKAYVCLVCKNIFNVRKDIRKHLREEHNVKGSPEGHHGRKTSPFHFYFASISRKELDETKGKDKKYFEYSTFKPNNLKEIEEEMYRGNEE